MDSRQDAKHAKFGEEEMNDVRTIIHSFSPNFAALAALREIFRGSLAPPPRLVLRRGYPPDKVPTA
jgi:hypothetical protein